MAETYLISAEVEEQLSACWGCREIMHRLRRDPQIIRYRPRCPACGAIYCSRHDMTAEELLATPVEGHA